MAADGILIGLSLLAGVVLGPLALALVPFAVGALAALRGRWCWSRVALALILALLGMARAAMQEEPVAVAELRASRTAVGIVDSQPMAGGDYERVVLRLESSGTGVDAQEPTSGRVLVYLPDGPGIGRGDRLLVTWSARDRASEPPGYADFLASTGVAGSASVWSYRVIDTGPAWLRWLSDLRRQIADALKVALPGDAGALAAGIVTGDDAAMSEELADTFRRTGTAHVTAVSGQNVALLLAFCALWMRPSRQRTRILAHVAMIALVWTYALMVGLEAPALRAAVVATLTVLGTYSGRRPDPLTILALTLGAMVMVEPRLAGGAGFWLSASASLALCSVMRIDHQPTLSAFIRRSALSVLAANIATLPIIVIVFHTWSPLSPLANLLIGPLLTITFPVTYVLALIATVSTGTGAWVAWIPGIGLDATLVIVRRIAEVAPLVYLDVEPLAATAIVGVPSALIVAGMSHDGERWLRVVERRWRRDRASLVATLAGAGLGAMVALVIATIV